MMIPIVRMWSCHRTRRRIQRYLDADPSAPLTDAERRWLEEHLATCERCAELAEDYRGLSRALEQWSASRSPDPAAVRRLHLLAEGLLTEDAE